MSKSKPIRPRSSSGLTIHQWFEQKPGAAVKRSELRRIIEGLELVSFGVLTTELERHEQARRARVWYRRLWRWITRQFVDDRRIEQLTPEQRAAVREALDVADQREAQPEPPDA